MVLWKIRSYAAAAHFSGKIFQTGSVDSLWIRFLKILDFFLENPRFSAKAVFAFFFQRISTGQKENLFHKRKFFLKKEGMQKVAFEKSSPFFKGGNISTPPIRRVSCPKSSPAFRQAFHRDFHSLWITRSKVTDKGCGGRGLPRYFFISLRISAISERRAISDFTCFSTAPMLEWMVE